MAMVCQPLVNSLDANPRGADSIGGGSVGAEVSGIDITQPLSESAFADLYQTYLDCGVLLLRGQQNATPSQFSDFCGRFEALIVGDLPSRCYHKKYSDLSLADTNESKYAHLNNPHIFIISNVEENGKPIGLAKAGLFWHTDQYYTERPSKTTSLFAQEIPSTGGDTLVMNMYQVYDALAEATKQKIDKLEIKHSYVRAWPHLYPTRAPLTDQAKDQTPDVVHSLLQTHPESGRRLLYMGAFYSDDNPGVEILGLPRDEAKALYAELRDFALQPQFIYRHRWAVGDILMTDNRCSMHSATPFDDATERRVLFRTTGKGDKTARVVM